MFSTKHLERVRTIHWEGLGTKKDDQHSMLVKEFLFRFLQVQKLIGSTSPHFEPREFISNEIKLPEHVRLEIRSLPVNFYVKLVLFRHLYICQLADSGDKTAIELIDLHLPLIEVLEDGGALDLDKQMNIVVDGEWTHPVHDLSYLISN